MLNFFIVAAIHTEDAEACIEVLCGQRILLLDFLSGTADALLADFADVLIACFVGFASRFNSFMELNKNEFPTSIVLVIIFYNSMCSSCTSRKDRRYK